MLQVTKTLTSDKYHAVAILLLWPLLITGALLTNAQYSQNTCDSARLIRCQQDVVRDLQTVSLNSASIQHPISSGPPYSPKQLMLQQQQQQQQLVNPSTCRLMRSNLDCLLTTTPACYDAGILAAQNTDILLRAKRFLEQNGCNHPDTTWQNSPCYSSPEIRSCEQRYGFNGYTSQLVSNATACLAYQAFKYCTDSQVRLNCRVHEMDMANEYLMDRASDLTFRCPANLTNANYLNPYQTNSNNYNQETRLLSPSHYSSGFGLGAYDNQQRPIPTYVGSNQDNNLNLFGSVHEQPWERFRQPVDSYGISRFPGSSGSGEIFDRLVAGDSSDCAIKAAPYSRECEDALLEQQRLARDSRDGNELQRRLCCSFFQYRDCVSRVVLDRCADSSPAAVELLMGTRKREMILTCRGFNRDVCSGSLAQTVLNSPMLIAIVLLTSFATFKQTQLSSTAYLSL